MFHFVFQKTGLNCFHSTDLGDMREAILHDHDVGPNDGTFADEAASDRTGGHAEQTRLQAQQAAVQHR